jgi:hypothetical protein
MMRWGLCVLMSGLGSAGQWRKWRASAHIECVHCAVHTPLIQWHARSCSRVAEARVSVFNTAFQLLYAGFACLYLGIPALDISCGSIRRYLAKNGTRHLGNARYRGNTRAAASLACYMQEGNNPNVERLLHKLRSSSCSSQR